jgi:hypothetical protein
MLSWAFPKSKVLKRCAFTYTPFCTLVTTTGLVAKTHRWMVGQEGPDTADGEREVP